MKQTIPNRYEIHDQCEGGFTQKVDAKDTLKEAKSVCKPTQTIYDSCKFKFVKL